MGFAEKNQQDALDCVPGSLASSLNAIRDLRGVVSVLDEKAVGIDQRLGGDYSKSPRAGGASEAKAAGPRPVASLREEIYNELNELSGRLHQIADTLNSVITAIG